jgi:hypothetical protein
MLLITVNEDNKTNAIKRVPKDTELNLKSDRDFSWED